MQENMKKLAEELVNLDIDLYLYETDCLHLVKHIIGSPSDFSFVNQYLSNDEFFIEVPRNSLTQTKALFKKYHPNFKHLGTKLGKLFYGD